MVAALVLGAGAANAESVFPSSANETTPLSLWAHDMRSIDVGASAVVTSVRDSGTEAPAFSFAADAMQIMGDRLHTTYGSVYPTSAHETDAQL